MYAKKECKEGVVQPGQPKTARINLFSVFIHLFISIGGITLYSGRVNSLMFGAMNEVSSVKSKVLTVGKLTF